MDTQRFILFAAMAFVIMMILQQWQSYQFALNPPVESAASLDTSTANTNLGVPKAESTAPADTKPTTAAPSHGERVKVSTDVFDLEINTLGGTFSQLALKRYPIKLSTPDSPVVLFEQTPAHTFLAQSGLTGEQHSFPNHNTVFRAEKTSYQLGDDDQLEVVLSWNSNDGVLYRKVFTFRRDSYAVGVRFEVDNQSNRAWRGHFYGQLSRSEPSDEGQRGFFSGGMPSFTGGAIYTDEDQYQKISFDDMREESLALTTSEGWAAMMQHYFVAAWLPATEHNDKGVQIYSSSNTAIPPVSKTGYLALTPVDIAAGQSGALGATLYTGPKEHDRLNAQDAKGLDLTIDFGWLTVIANPLFWVLSQIHKLVGNWGWSIILVTMLIKLAFLPLSAASYKSMAKMKKLSPRLQTLKERYGDDRQKFQQAMMELYKAEKVNPAGGCLPILIQIPVFIALYWVLLESVELRQAPWAFWIHDLSSKDPYYILPVLMGGSMFFQQWLNPAPMDPLQQKLMMALPLVFTVFFLSFPSGLVLYWVVNNVLSIAQQWMIQRRYT